MINEIPCDSENESHMQILNSSKSGYTCKINKYVCLGSGSFGSVHPGYFKSSSGQKIHVAVKIVNIRKSEHQLFQKILERQQKTYKKIFMSKHIVRLYSCIRDQNNTYFVMEKCDEDLSVFLLNKQLNQKQIRFYFRQILLGYNELYLKEITHNDIKPQNILVKDKSLLKLADFGLAQSFYDNNPSFASTNNRSWNTTSPQMRFHQGKITPQSDIWSLGAVLYWMIYKKYPYLQKSTKQNYYIKPSFIGISQQLKSVLTNLLQFQPQKRWKFPKLLSNNLFIKQHFIQQQSNNPQQQFEQPIFIDVSVIQQNSDKKPSIQFYQYDIQFQQDQIETTLKRQIKSQFSIIKLKINYIQILLKKIQYYSVLNIPNLQLKKQILFYKKITIQSLKNYINYFHQLLIDGKFIPSDIFIKAKQKQQTNNYIAYITAIYKIQIRKWIQNTIQQNNLINNYQEQMNNYSWILKKNWKQTKNNIDSNVLQVVKDFIIKLRGIQLNKQQYLLIHYLLLVYNHKDVFKGLKDKRKYQSLIKFISYLAESDPNLNYHHIQIFIQSI